MKSAQGNLVKSKKYTTPEERRASVEEAFDACAFDPPVTVKAMAEFMEVTTRCARDRIREFDDEFKIKNGCVFRM